MYGWCKECEAVALDGRCSEHGATKPLSFINSIDVRPLTDFEKKLINTKQTKMKLDDGIFLAYGDRYYRRKIVFIDDILVEFKLLKDGMHVTPHKKGIIKGMKSENLFKVNRERLNQLVQTSKEFASYEYNENGYENILSFSGGKDSIVLEHLIRESNMKNVFIDTRIEFPETYSLIKNYQNNQSKIEIVKAKNSFFTLCREKGYPEYSNRWCCKTQKFKPFNDYLSEKFDEEYVRVFTGQRRWEGLSRLDSPFIKPHKHITKQLSIQPMLEWFTMDVWNYIWKNNLPINKLYDYFDRAGCWTCPFGLKYRCFILRYTHPKLFKLLKKYNAVSGIENYSEISEEEKPCEIEVNGKIMRTCDAFGHYFKKGVCFRCGQKETLSTVC